MYTSYTYCNSGHAIIKIQENKHERDSRERQRSEKEKKTGHYQENSFNGCIRTGFAWPNKGEKATPNLPERHSIPSPPMPTYQHSVIMVVLRT